MNVDRAKIPSPFTGEDASRSEAGEGLGSAVLGSGSACIHGPSPGRSLRSRLRPGRTRQGFAMRVAIEAWGRTKAWLRR